MEKYTDIHTLFVKYGVATREQVEEIIADAIAQIGKLAANETSGVSLKELSELSYETNHPVDKEGKTMGSCYL
jgi:hypothetical protein